MTLHRPIFGLPAYPRQLILSDMLKILSPKRVHLMCMQVSFTLYRDSHTHTYHIQRFTFRDSHSTERLSRLRQRKGLVRPALLGSPNHSPLNTPGVIPGLNADLGFALCTSMQLTSVRHIWMPPTMSSCLRPALSTIRIATRVPITIAAPICNNKRPNLSTPPLP